MIDFLVDYPIIGFCVDVTMIIISISLIINLLSVFSNKTDVNRIILMESFINLVMAIMILYGLKHGTYQYTNGILIICILSFTSMVVWSKYISQGNIVYPLTESAAAKVSLESLNESRAAMEYALLLDIEHEEAEKTKSPIANDHEK